MACEYVALPNQTIALNGPVQFADSIPCGSGRIYHENGSGVFQLRNREQRCNRNRCRCCCQEQTADFNVIFTGNIAIPEGGTVGPIALAITVGGEPIEASRAIYTPAAVDEYQNVTVSKVVKVPCGCCPSIAIEYVNGSVNDPTFTPTPVISLSNGTLKIDPDFD